MVRRLLVFGASQGARVFNELVPKIAGRLLDAFPELEVVHQTGARHGESTLETYRASLAVGFERVVVTPYLDDMPRQFGGCGSDSVPEWGEFCGGVGCGG